MNKFRFKSFKFASSFAANCIKAKMIILGDDEYFWVVSMKDGEKLLRAGYEVAR